MTRSLSSLAPMFIRCTAIAFAFGAFACAPSGNAPDASSSGMNLALIGSSEANTNVHVLLKSNGKDGEKRDVALHANANATESFELEPGEHVLAIVCTDEEGNALLGTGTATFATEANTNLMILVDVDSLIDGEEIPEEVVEEAAAELEASAEAGAEANADAETDGDEDDANVDAGVNADVDVNVEGDGNVDADADVNAETDAANANADASTDASTGASTDASTSSGGASASASASAGIAVVTSSETSEPHADDGDACDDTCQAECLDELLDLCGF